MNFRIIPSYRKIRWPAVRRIWSHFGDLAWQERRSFLVSFIGTLGLALAEILGPWPLKVIFDYALLRKEGEGIWAGIATWMQAHTAEGLVVASLAIVVIAVLAGLFGFLEAMTVAGAAQRIVFGIRGRLYRHLQMLSLDFHDSSQSGDLLMRLTGDVNMMREMLSGSAIALTSTAFVFVGMTVVMALMDPVLTVAALIIVPALALAVGRLSGQLKSAVSKQRKREGRLAAAVHETLIGIRAVKAFGREKEEEKRFARSNRRSLNEGLRAKRLELALSRLVKVLIACGTCGVVLIGAHRVYAGTITPGDLLVFMAYVQKMYKPMSRISRLLAHMMKAVACGERVIEVLERRPTVTDAPDAVAAPAFRGRIEFERVTFGYAEGERALRRVAFNAEPGELVALVGRTGAGKSTIFNLLLRFYEPLRGRVLIDGEDIQRYTTESLREQIGIVLQEPLLFGLTVHENIAFGKPKASREKVLEAAMKAGADEFIQELPKGYDTRIAERGVSLSGGQKQRIAIARAILRKSPILLLDEPHTGLDAETESKVADSLKKLMADRTTFVIAHRLATVIAADRILLLDKGKLIAQGTHAELYAENDFYRRLCDLSLGRGLDLAVTARTPDPDEERVPGGRDPLLLSREAAR
jgi:ATP-binding cassette subfamily B protein